jgi:SAM-dependent methyltransferase
MLGWLHRKSHTRVVIDLWKSPESPALDYFRTAESDAWMRGFWSPGSRFLAQFQKLDLTAVLDLACGQGRHAAQFVERAGHVTLFDTSPIAIEACRARFEARRNLTYILSESGRSLAPIADASLTAVMSYDAMVHFERGCVLGYVREVARVLRSGGRALIHHSVYGKHPRRDFRANPDWRAYMPEAEFKAAATGAGLRIESFEAFAWSGSEVTDGLTLVSKP